MSQDNLKSMFDQAFAAEQIPFDPAGWNQMNTMLNARHRRRFLGIWLSSLLLFVTGGIAVLAGFSNEATYTPRTSVKESNYIALEKGSVTSEGDFDIEKTNSEHASNLDYENSSMSELKTADSPKSNATPAIDPQPKKDDLTTYDLMVEANLTKDDEKIAVNSTNGLDPALSLKESESMPSFKANGNTEPSVPAAIEAQRELDLIEFLPILTLQTNEGQISPTDNTPEANKTKYIPALYLTAGMNKTSGNGFSFYDGLGQRVGIGGSYQWREHIMLNAEISGSRLRISDTAHISSSPTYGFTEMKNSYIINTSELMMVDLPVFVHYRMKRYYVGAGLAITYMAGMKNETIQRVEANQSVVTTTQDEGYYRWDRYRTFGANILADFQVQLTDDLFIGARGSYSLNNALTIESRRLQLARLDAYVKFNIK